MEHDPDSLRARRASRARALRRRRRVAGAALVAAALAVIAVVVAVATAGPSHGPPTGGVAKAAARARSRAPERSSARARRAHLAAQATAARRLASYGLPLYCGGQRKRMVALTFDDGPGVYTQLALRKLRAAHLRATFFLVGKELSAYPGLARLEKPVGAVGDHTITHPFLPALAQSAMVQEIAGARMMIERAADQPVLLFRPPYEGHTPAIDREVKALGMVEVLWNVDSADSLGANYAGIEHNVIAGLHPGSIVLMHENRGQTIRALPVIFAALARRHLRAVTVPELIASDPPSPAQLRAGGHGCSVALTAGSGG